MAEHVYEGMYIFDSNRYGRDANGTAASISGAVEKLGGSMLVNRLWEERRLAYPINGQRKGTYWLSYFKLDSKNITALKRDLALNETVMRSLILKVDPRIVDTLVSHAMAGPTDANRIRRPDAAMGMGMGAPRRSRPAIAEVIEEIPVDEIGN